MGIWPWYKYKVRINKMSDSEKNSEQTFRVILADDHDIIRQGMKANLLDYPDISVVGEARNGEELLALLEKRTCDLVVVDLSMPGIAGLVLIEKIREEYPEQRVCILSSYEEYWRQARKLGVAGYILKKELTERIAAGIAKILKGGTYYSKELSDISRPGDERPGGDVLPEILSARERELLAEIVHGKKNKDIAAEWDVSLRTVEFHKTNIKKKLRLDSTADLVKFAIKHNIGA